MLRGTKRKIKIETGETEQQRPDVACNKRHKTVSFDQNPSSTSSLYGSSSQFVYDFDHNTSFLTEIYGWSSSKFASLGQNPNSYSLDHIYGGSSSQIATYGQNPNSCSLYEIYGGSSSSQIASYGQNPSSFVEEIQGGYVLEEAKEEKNNLISVKQEPRSEPVVNVGGFDDVGFWENLYNNDVFGLNGEIFGGGSSSEFASFGQNPNSSFDQNPSSSSVEEIQGGSSSSSSSDQSCCFEKNNAKILTQETKTEPMLNDDESFWKNLFNDDVLGLYNDQDGDFMIDIEDFFTKEELELLYGVEEIPSGSSSSDQRSCLENNGLLETKEEENNSISVTQETPSEPMVGGSDVDIVWKKVCNDAMFGLNNNTPANTTNEEDDFMTEIGDIFTEEYIELLCT